MAYFLRSCHGPQRQQQGFAFPDSPSLAHGCGSATMIEHTIGIVGLILGICLILRIMLTAGP